MSDQFREWLALVPWLDEQTALIIVGGLAAIIIIWLVARSARRKKPVVQTEGDLRILLADVAGELRESASSTILTHFTRDLGTSSRAPRIAVIRYPELIGVEDETGEVDLAEPDAAEISKARRGEDADLLVWGRATLDDGNVTMRFAPVEATGDTGNPTKFSPAKITIPYSQLSLGPGAILSTAILGSVATTARERGLTLGGQLQPLVDRLHAVTRGEARDLPEQCRYDALRALAWGWLTLGIENDDIDLMAKSAETYKELLRFERKESDPREDAELRLNFAAASLAVGEARDDPDAMRCVVESALIALETYNPENHPAEWVFLQDRFARASAWLGIQKDDAGELKDAVTAFRNVLGVWNVEKVPGLWAATQHRFADTLAALGRRSVGTQSLEQSAAAYREALRNGEAIDGVVDRAMLRRGLAQVLTDLGTRLGQPERHEEAIQALQLMEQPVEPGATRSSDPETKRAIGHAVLALASTSQDPLDMAKAARALKAATSLRPEGPVSMAWSETYRDLGSAMAALGAVRRRQPLLKDAVGAFHTALDGVQIERSPAAWTQIQRQLADVQLKLARLGDGGPAADAAVETFDKLLATYDDDTEAHRVGEAFEGRGDAHMIKARASEDDAAEELGQATDSYKEALGKIDKAHSPLLWAKLQGKIGEALAFAGGQSGDSKTLSESADAFRAALDVWTPTAAPGERGRMLNALGHVLADMDGNAAGQEANKAFEEAGQLFLAQGANERAAGAEWSLRRPKPAGSTRIKSWSPPPESLTAKEPAIKPKPKEVDVPKSSADKPAEKPDSKVADAAADDDKDAKMSEAETPDAGDDKSGKTGDAKKPGDTPENKVGGLAAANTDKKRETESVS